MGDHVYVGVAAVNPYVSAAVFIVEKLKKLAEMSRTDSVEAAIQLLAEQISQLVEIIADISGSTAVGGRAA
jgi:hypothetical protein